MDKNKIKLLRQRISVGLQQGLILLEKTNGDITQAELLFQEETITLFVTKTGVEREIAKNTL